MSSRLFLLSVVNIKLELNHMKVEGVFLSIFAFSLARKIIA